MTELPLLGSVFSFLWASLLAAIGCAIAIWAARQNQKPSGVVAHLTRSPPIAQPQTNELTETKMVDDR